MHEVKVLRQLLDDRLKELNFPVQPANLYDPIRYMLAIGGKRMRPLLVLMGCELFKGDVSKAINPALGVEVFHNFTLLHDDIMDNAPLRRTMQTIHEKWNVSVAILSGDAMYVKAVQLVMQTDDKYMRPLLDLFNKTALQVCEGQQLDMDFENRNDITLIDYLQMIELKTAVLLGCALQMGAITAGADEASAIHLYETGRNLGIAFQIQDDLLDLYGNDEFGKKPGGDIIANKKTFLLLKAMEKASSGEQDMIHSIITDKTIDDVQRIEKIKAIFDSLHIVKNTEAAMDHFYNKAMSELSALNVEAANKQSLIALAHSLRIRVA